VTSSSLPKKRVIPEDVADAVKRAVERGEASYALDAVEVWVAERDEAIARSDAAVPGPEEWSRDETAGCGKLSSSR